ncbi:MAG: neutral/alkaline non-lysosomal ceramidase N-terminal domain-containing protein [Acidobacteria bacterium]|nr:neutral/alkaline non-lysosomal ceramidase N-terminal domain-containing protein [Acidobacteriota bacterium]
MRILAALALLAPGLALAEFRASAVKLDITPPSPQWLMGYAARQSTGVHDRIYHRIAALSDGATEVYLISSDLCVFSPGVYDDFTAALEKRTGIHPKQVWWMATHTHSAPEVGPPGMYDALLHGRSDHDWSRDYLAFVTSSLEEGILKARAALEPARVAIGVGTARANINRRARDLDGTISLGLNPDGPVDRQIGLIRLERPDGAPIALIANYAMHGTALGGRSTQISADAPGAAAAYVEEKFGAPVLYVNGAAGDIAPIYSVYDTPRAAHLGEFRILLGDRILEANRALRGAAQPALELAEATVETPRKSGLGWPAELGRYAARTAGGEDLVRLPIRYLRIGDAAIWSAPVELFCEIALRVRAESPFRQTFYFGYANGWLGYLPTAAAFREGGYEPRTSPFTPDAERDLGNAVSAFLAGWVR